MKKVLLSFFLIFSFSITAYGWEKVPIPDYVNKKTKSPWNFFDDFEDQKLGKVNLKKYEINNKGKGNKPFKIKQDTDGNKFLEITVKHGWNKCCGSWNNTERAEFQVKGKKTLNKEIWYGFKVRLPKDFNHINDRVLINQFKNNFDNMKKSPLLGIRFYENGNKLDLGGDTGGRATIKWNKKEHKKHAIRYQYLKVNDSWVLNKIKERDTDYGNVSTCNNENNCSGCEEYFTRGICCYDLDGKPIWKKKGYLNSGEKPSFCNKIKKIKKKIEVNELGKWTTFKIGIKNSKKEDGYVKVYKDNNLIMNYNGITFDWKGNYYSSLIRIGLYRNSDPNGTGYPDQSIHFDDFIVVSDKKTLDKYLN